MSKPILYLGDTALDQQASYLAGIMTHYGIEFDYIDSYTKFPDSCLDKDYALTIISDYPASNFTVEQMQAIADKAKTGMSLLMIGGWESYVGLGGGYNDTPIEDALPVSMQSSDDRTNFSSPCLVIPSRTHEITESLPFDQSLPAIGGLNSFTPDPNAEVLLTAVQFKAASTDGKVTFTEGDSYPLLVVTETPSSKTAALATDVAPHWVGPLVDWGDTRVKAQAKGAEAVEVGNWYAKFFANLINWLIAE
jgi:uncharacterized membrane protein